MKIYKYTDIGEVDLPADSRVLCAKNQHEKGVIYVVVGTSTTKKTLKMLGIQTGADVGDIGDYIYLDTVLFSNGHYVLHFYYEWE